jgi:hypothetical protein
MRKKTNKISDRWKYVQHVISNVNCFRMRIMERGRNLRISSLFPWLFMTPEVNSRLHFSPPQSEWRHLIPLHLHETITVSP